MSAPTWPEQRAEGYASARALGRTILAVLSVTVIGALLGVVLFATAAHAAGSDSPTPYTVDRTGITLPAGQTVPDNGHVNIRWTGGAAGLHFEGKCVTRTDAECAGARHDAAQFIGAAFIPWSAFGVPSHACITWVQISTFDEHFGEGGQAPVCLTEEEPCPTETPSTEPTPTTEPEPTATTEPGSSPAPTSPSTPTTEPSPTPSDPEPSASTPSAPSSPSPTTEPSASAATAPAAPAGTDDVTYTSQVSAVPGSPAPGAELAATGTSAVAVVLLAAGLLVLGAYLVAFERRNRR